MTLTVGDAVVVGDRHHAGHHRTPGYLKGKRGTVARVHGTFTNPETSAYGQGGPPGRRLYLVAFEWDDVWSKPNPGDTVVYADIFEHWLERAS